MRWLPFALLVACEAMPPTGAPMQPVPRAAKPAPASVPGSETPAAPVAADGFDFEEDEGDAADEALDVGEEVEDDPATLLALAQGLPVPEPAPALRPAVDILPAPTGIASASQPVAMRVWDPGVASAPDWGVRLVSTVVDTQPPRAILGLANGTEVVVQPGTMLADSKLVVMAVGRDVLQISRVVPEGYQARIETKTLRAFYPAETAAQ